MVSFGWLRRPTQASEEVAPVDRVKFGRRIARERVTTMKIKVSIFLYVVVPEGEAEAEQVREGLEHHLQQDLYQGSEVAVRLHINKLSDTPVVVTIDGLEQHPESENVLDGVNAYLVREDVLQSA